VAATHRDLAASVREGRFRHDLFHRLDVFGVHVPPLRERPDDVLPLARFFLAELAGRAGKAIAGLAPETEARLLAYPFPGNVRELRNVVERAVILETGDRLTPSALLLRAGVVEPAATTGAASGAAQAATRTPGGDPPTLAEVERAYLVGLLERAGGNKSQVARWMGVSFPTVAKRIADLGLDLSRWKEPRGEG
jgi:two-component system response regulator AtoC